MSTSADRPRIRLAALGLYHESNTFVSARTGYREFEQTEILRGASIIESHGEAHSSMAGFLSVADVGVEIVPLIFARANPSGPIAQDAFESLLAEMVMSVRADGPWDGVLLALHGAAVADGYPDADGEIAARIRDAVGQQVPIGLAIDLHANVSQRMIEHVTVTTIYRTNPHIDARARAKECAEIVIKAIAGEVSPVQALEPVGAAINILRQCTSEAPMANLLVDLDAVLARPGILTASFAEGYPYADVAEMGMSALAVHDGDAGAATAAARWLIERVWAQRTELVGEAVAVDDALLEAAAAPLGPVVLMDVGDNIGGGSPGDSTVLLEAARRLGITGLLMILFDPEGAAHCAKQGVGQATSWAVGGKSPGQDGHPVPVTGSIRAISDGRFEEPAPTHGGFRFFDAGLTAVLETTDNHTLVLISKLVAPVSLQQLTTLGLDPAAFQIIVAKGVHSPRAAYEDIATRIMMVDTPGVTAADLSTLPYRQRPRPLFPFELERAVAPTTAPAPETASL